MQRQPRPRTARRPGGAGVEVLHNPHSNYLGSLGRDAEEWERGKLVYYLDRVAQTRCHMLVHNMAGRATDTQGREHVYAGGALMIDPLGQVVARTSRHDNEESMLVARIDTDLTKYVPSFEACHAPLKDLPRVRQAFPAS